MKNSIFYILFIVAFSSCSAVKSVFTPKQNETTRTQPNDPYNGKEIKTANQPASSHTNSSGKSNAIVFNTKNIVASSPSLEFFSSTQFKYAIRLDVPVELIQNKLLYDVIEEWWGTRYRLGGTTHSGIDCSAFMQALAFGVFSIQLPRTAREQKTITEWIPLSEAKEGDLVFFNTRGGVSHVGMYLQNNKFVHASTSSGVMISDLNDSYWSRKFLAVGRILQSLLPKP